MTESDRHIPEPDDSNPITIVRFDNPQELLTDEAINRLGLAELISKGYGYPIPDTSGEIRDFVDIEYGKANIVFLALKDHKAIGSLAYTFIAKERMGLESKEPVSILHIEGIVVDPDNPIKGLGEKLIDTSIDTLHPDLILADTKTPSLIPSFARAAYRHGLRTFYGMYETTPGQEFTKVETHKSLLTAYAGIIPQIAEGYEFQTDADLERNGVFGVDTRVLQPTLPEVRGNLRSIFEPIMHKQRKFGKRMTAVGVLMASHPRLLRPKN